MADQINNTRPDHRSSGPSLRPIASTIVIAALICFSFGVSPHDEAAFRTFSASIDRWQTDPEFRAAAMQYCILGSAATRTQFLFIRTGRIVMALCSIPLLPARFSVNPTSQSHYDDFGRGPLCAYLHLCGEQSVGDVESMVERTANTSGLSDAGLREFLDSFKMDFPVAKDRGAIRSAAALILDTDARRPFSIRANIGPLLRPDIAGVASELGIPPDPWRMTPAEQETVLDRLDGYVRRYDPELWRTKQVSDFAGGVWAQVFGPPYNNLIKPVLVIGKACQLALLIVLTILAARVRWGASSPRRAHHLAPGKARNDSRNEFNLLIATELIV